MLMGQFRFIKRKIRLIYTAPLLYFMMFLQISFLVIYMYVNETNGVSDYMNLLKKDLFLWMISIPVMVLQHKVSIYSTYYSCISRISCKRSMIFVDYITLAVSTCISTCLLLSVPLLFLLIKGTAPADPETVFTFFFLLTRYILLGVLVQYIIYSIMYAFPNLQKKGGSICVLPFLLYFVFTSPMEILRIRGQYLLISDFSAGGITVLAMDGAVSWSSVFFYNMHLAGYLVLYIWITMYCFSGRWEFLENESDCTP